MLISKQDLVSLDNRIYTQAKQALVGRSLFQSFAIDRYAESYAYDVYKTTGKAKRTTNNGRNTDTPVGDETKERFLIPMTSFEYGIEYTDDELGRAQFIKDTNFITRKADQAVRAMAEYEDKVIFNGLPEDKITGLTSKVSATGFQEQAIDGSKTLSDLDNNSILNFFKEASHKITRLGYSNDKPVLLLTDAIEEKLDTFFNDYRDTSIEDYINRYFSDIKVVKELEAQYTGRKKDMAIACLTDFDTAGIPTAIPVERNLNQHLDNRTTIKYREKFGGLAVRYPSHIVQMPDLI